MELDDLKNTWKEVSQLEQQHLTPEIIDRMTRKKYYTSLKKLAYPEIAGVVICFTAAAFLVLNFNKLDTTFLQGTGALSTLLLLALPVISLASLWQFGITGDVNRPFTETLKKFAVQKIRFLRLQRMNVTLSYLLLVTVIILLSKLFGGKDITGSRYFWAFSFCFGYIFLLFYSRWVLKHYQKTLQQAEELLHELES